MNLLEFWSFAKDCKFVSKTMTASHLEAIFEKVALAGTAALFVQATNDALKTPNTAGLTSSKLQDSKWMSATSTSHGLLRTGTIASTGIGLGSSGMMSGGGPALGRVFSTAGGGGGSGGNSIVSSPRDGEAGGGGGGGGAGSNTALNRTVSAAVRMGGELELSPSQFVEALIRIADARYKLTPKLSARVRLLLKSHVLKNARRLDTDQFRTRFRKPEFLDVFRKHRRKLRKIFYYFATMESVKRGQEKWTNTIDLKEFTAMVRSARLVGTGAPDAALTADDVKAIFANIRKDEFDTSGAALGWTLDDEDITKAGAAAGAAAAGLGAPSASGSAGSGDTKTDLDATVNASQSGTAAASAASGGGGSGSGGGSKSLDPDASVDEIELIYPEFLEALVALATFKYPNPYLPLVQRLENFLTRDFVPILMRSISAPQRNTAKLF